MKNNLNEIVLYTVKRQVQDLNNSYCGVYCLYFIYNLFNPTSTSQIVEDKLCTVTTIQKLFKELFPKTKNIEEFTRVMRIFAEEFSIRGDFE